MFYEHHFDHLRDGDDDKKDNLLIYIMKPIRDTYPKMSKYLPTYVSCMAVPMHVCIACSSVISAEGARTMENRTAGINGQPM
jgi:hypothetical protein